MWKKVQLFLVRIYIKQLNFCGNCLQTEAQIKNAAKHIFPAPHLEPPLTTMTFQTIKNDLSVTSAFSIQPSAPSAFLCAFSLNQWTFVCPVCLNSHNLILLHRGQTFHDPQVFHWYLQLLKADLINKDQGEECTWGTLAFTMSFSTRSAPNSIQRTNLRLISRHFIPYPPFHTFLYLNNPRREC